MTSPRFLSSSMPDVARDAVPFAAGRLDWVGMSGIEAPLRVLTDAGESLRCPARVQAFVDLDSPAARGIHMSRLYLHLDQALARDALTPLSLRRLLRQFLDSHRGLSGQARLRFDFELLLRRAALRSDNAGWRSYPVAITARMDAEQFVLELSYRVLYSSTCPASAALARQLIQQGFDADFPPDLALDHAAVRAWLGSAQGISATPHSQRSAAEVRVRLGAAGDVFPFVALIDRVEQALMTPVQTAVKREDEQAFAQLNGGNLMFCEDAARRVQAALDADPRILDFLVRVSHFESLHPHDAMAVASKGVAGGWRGGVDL